MKSYKGLILIYPGFQNDAKKYQYGRLIEEFVKLGIEVDKLKVDEIFFAIENGRVNFDLTEYDFCVQLVRDKYIDAVLRKNNIRSFNSYEANANCDDKMMAYTLLADEGIKMPTTISAVLNRGNEEIADQSLSNNFKDKAVQILGFPLVAKKQNSKGGRGIYKIDNREILEDVFEELSGDDFLLQEFISENVGKDIRVIVIGGRVEGAFMRVNEKDFRSNIKLGGIVKSYDISQEMTEAAERIAKILKLDYCSVDFFVTEGEPILCEVNADPALQSAEEIIGRNLAKIFAEYIFHEIK
ncbi:RimK family alpha-L-glutamate ligase [Candidatus Saccharibacteria bacterium]|nr:RimK family alpha-L-glutamate ligase [Candidatus Saccharibacteria bacterium]